MNTISNAFMSTVWKIKSGLLDHFCPLKLLMWDISASHLEAIFSAQNDSHYWHDVRQLTTVLWAKNACWFLHVACFLLIILCHSIAVTWRRSLQLCESFYALKMAPKSVARTSEVNNFNGPRPSRPEFISLKNMVFVRELSYQVCLQKYSYITQCRRLRTVTRHTNTEQATDIDLCLVLYTT